MIDSSSEAYGVAIYIREISKSKQVHTTLYSAKCRLVPSKGLVSIPRLELLSCLLLSEQKKAVFDAISIKTTINEVFCWSDSQITLWWIKQVQKSWKIRVQNRVEKIRSNVPIDSWRYIRTDQNPADIVVLLGNLLWWEGPSLLKIEDSVWPEAMLDGFKVAGGKETVEFELNNETFPDFSSSGSSLILEAGVDLEEKLVNSNSVVLQSTVEASGGIGIVTHIELFSDLERLLRVTAFVVRFVSNFKKSVKKTEGVYSELAVEEL